MLTASVIRTVSSVSSLQSMFLNRPNYIFSANFCTSTDPLHKAPTEIKSTHNLENDFSSNNRLTHHSTDDPQAALTHVDHHGNAAMVNVSSKDTTHRKAVASGKISLSPDAFQLVQFNQLSKKGSVLGVAQLAGIMAAKQTSNLIPLCHNIPLTKVGLNFELYESEYVVRACASVECVGVTGVEMEALTAVSVALLTVYDMTKAVSKDHVISDIWLEEKEGGASGHFRRD